MTQWALGRLRGQRLRGQDQLNSAFGENVIMPGPVSAQHPRELVAPAVAVTAHRPDPLRWDETFRKR